jgi:hypothetical protein
MLGIYAAIGTWSLPTSILTGTGAAEGLALINSIGNCGGFAGPIIVGQLNAPREISPARFCPSPGPLALGGAPSMHFGHIEEKRRRSRGAI